MPHSILSNATPIGAGQFCFSSSFVVDDIDYDYTKLSKTRLGNSMVLTTLAVEPDLNAVEFIDVLRRSTLADRRPTDDAQTIEQMLRNAQLIITARQGELLVGVSRAITDFAYCTYLSDLAVDQKFQRQGIGKRLVERTHEEAGHHTTLILLSAPQATSYYPHIGMQRHDSCWLTSRK